MLSIYKLVPGAGLNVAIVEGPVGKGKRFLPATEIGGSVQEVVISALSQLLQQTRLRRAARAVPVDSKQVEHMAFVINERRLR